MTTSSSPAAERAPRSLGPVPRAPRPAASASARPRGPWRDVVLGGALLLASCLAAVGIGAADLPAGDVAASIASHLGLRSSPLTPLADSVVWELRVPRVLLAACVGAGLALCGCVLQALTRNVLADPYLLGISSGASTGAVAVLVLGLGAGVVGLAGGAFVGGLLAFGAVVFLAGAGGRTSSITRVVLTGVAVGQIASALTALVLLGSGDAQTVRGITYWLLGSLTGARWESVALTAAVVLVGGAVCWSWATALDAFTFGADAAAGLGVSVRSTRAVLLVTTALVTAVVVAASGAIGFVGLVVPHVVRSLVGAGHRRLLPASALAGGVFLVWTDALARAVFDPQEIPVGVVTALVGAPVFLVVLRRRGVGTAS